MTVLHLDYETFSDRELRTQGLDLYMSSPNAEALMCSWAYDRDPVAIWDKEDGRFPAHLAEAIVDPGVEKRAFNATFERTASKRLLGIDTPIAGWRCTMALAYMQSFTGTLEQVGNQVGLPEDKQKLKTGKDLIKLFCKPQKITKNQPFERRDALTDPDKWAEFKSYCVQDTETERTIWNRLHPFLDYDRWAKREWNLYALDQEINDRGFPIDRLFVENAIAMVRMRKDQLRKQMEALTGLFNPNSTDQLLPWLKAEGYPFDDVQKATVQKVLTENEEAPNQGRITFITERCDSVLRLRQWAARQSVAKYVALQKSLAPDDLCRFGFQYGGASRTLRFSGRRFQPHNLPRAPRSLEPDKKLLALGLRKDEWLASVTEIIRSGDYESLQLFMEEPMEALVGALRSAIRAPDDCELTVADLASIETRVTAWVAGCERLLTVVKEGLDPYIDFATTLYSKAYEDVTKRERQDSKPAVLGCLKNDTPVLTLRGWVRLDCVRADDLVCDGSNFVSHDGLVNQGERVCMNLLGVLITPEHEVEADQWRQAQNLDFRYCRMALDTASSRLSDMSKTDLQPDKSILCGVAVDGSLSRLAASWSGQDEQLGSVSRAPESTRASVEIVSALCSSISSPTGSMQSEHDAQTLITNTSIAMAVEGLDASSQVRMSSSLTLSMSLARTDRLRLIASITTGAISKAIFASVTGRSITPTNGTVTKSNTADDCMQQPSLGDCSPPLTETTPLSLEKPERDLPPERLSTGSETAKVHTTFDILNAGPNRRYVILSEEGPLVVHNCTYRLGGGELRNGKRTGLWGYAESMGVNLTQKESTRAVTAFRDAYPEIPRAWYALENAVEWCIRTGKNQVPHFRIGDREVRLPVEMEHRKPYLLIWLPSGRPLFYHLPRLHEEVRRSRPTEEHPEGREYDKTVFSYMGTDQVTGQWKRIETHGGKIIENIVQAIARDILIFGLLRAAKAGFNIIGHVHDEIITLSRKGDNYYTVDRLCQLMARPIKWCSDLPLGAAGYREIFYRKD